MFALDRPVTASPGAFLTPGNYLSSWQPIMKPRRYEVRSSLEMARQDLQPREQERLLEVPASISPRVSELAQSWRAADPDPHGIVGRALVFFQTQRSRISVSA